MLNTYKIVHRAYERFKIQELERNERFPVKNITE